MISVEQWQQEGNYFSFEQRRIFYRDSGEVDKPTLLLIHGFPTSSWDYTHVWGVLAEKFRLVTLDMIGYGFSDKPKNFHYSIKRQVDIIEQILESLSIEQCHVLSHDYGDSVAQELLARDLESDHKKVLSLIMLNGGVIPESQRPVLLQKLLLGPFGFIISRLTSYSRFKKNFDKICAVKLPEEEIRTYWELTQLQDGVFRIPKVIQYIKERKQNRDRWVGALQNARCPICFINGLEDPVSGKYMVESFKKLVEKAEVVELENIGHYPQVESPELVLKSANQFWEAHLNG
ncbi:alpha/beta hydrolase [Aliikangiella marina]|uniref:Alpha/beta hydrolase n=1 Tax=Aliikangiella marina TaxID=1712262 RepID=A0A545T7G0_9GAMM|nr:alpha/beta hydrolase [Aliikangiella marina]TQV73159.1 alpha/beta hydrolase [Aliikangiella marina]